MNVFMNSDRAKRGLAARRKGANYERELARKLKEFFGDNSEIKRGIGQARSAHEVPDVVCPPLWIEAKRHIKCSPRQALAQAQNDLAKHKKLNTKSPFTTPIAITKDNRDQPIVTLLLSDFLVLLYPDKLNLAYALFGDPKTPPPKPQPKLPSLNPPRAPKSPIIPM